MRREKRRSPITTCAVEPVIKNWMRDILGLSANRLLAYAYLLAATADNKAVYGSLESFGRLFGTSGQTAITVVNSLVTLDLLKCVGNSRARNATLFIPLVRNEAEALEWYRKRMGKEYGTADIFLSSERAENAPVKEGKNA